MIDEKKLIEELEKWKEQSVEDEHDQIWNNAINQCIIEVKRQPKVTEWIPVEERLPKVDEKVLVTYLGYFDKKPMCDSAAYRDEFGDWLWVEDDEHVKVKITAWMPLPEPCKGVSEDVE